MAEEKTRDHRTAALRAKLKRKRGGAASLVAEVERLVSGRAVAPRKEEAAAAAAEGYTRVMMTGLAPGMDSAALRLHLDRLAGVGACLLEGRLLPVTRNHWLPLGEVTDVSVPRKHGDASRGFAFVGLATPAAARDFVAKFDRSYVGSARIRVKPALARRAPSADAGVVVAREEDMPMTKKKAKMTAAREVDSKSATTAQVEAPTRRDRFFELMTKRGAGVDALRADEEDAPAKKATCLKEEDYLSSSKDKNNAALDDLAYLKSKQAEGAFSDDDDDDDDDGATSDGAKDSDSDSSDSEDGVTARTRLYVSNVAFGVDEAKLEAAFGAFGTVAEVHAPIDPVTKQARGFAFVTYVLPSAAQKAREAMDGADWCGRTLAVTDAHDRADRKEEEASSSKTQKKKKHLTFAAKREEERRNKATVKDIGWHAAHVDANAAGEAVAAALGVSKREVMGGRSSGEAAVTLALAESAVQTQTAAFFADHGYAPSSKKKKTASRTALLVKNLPHATAAPEIDALLDRAGVAGRRVLCAPAGVSAVVEFDAPAEARAAFKKMAYKRFKHVPLYVEWAPEKKLLSKQEESGSTNKAAAAASAASAAADDDDEEGGPAPATQRTTLYVKNLNFATDSSKLEAFFTSVAKPRAVVLPPPPPEEGEAKKRQNRGFGFVEFATEADAVQALKARQGGKVDDHALHLALTNNQKNQKNQKNSRGQAGEGVTKHNFLATRTKLVVRNLAFATTANDVRALFAAMGELASVRVPKRFDGRHRGFAFVTFAAARDAARALEALKSTHLYGRHLVIEYADAKNMSEPKEVE